MMRRRGWNERVLRLVEFVEQVEYAVARGRIASDLQVAGASELLDGGLAQIQSGPDLARQGEREVGLAIVVVVRVGDVLDNTTSHMKRHGRVLRIGELEPDHGIRVLRPDRVDADAVTIDELARFERLDLFHRR